MEKTEATSEAPIPTSHGPALEALMVTDTLSWWRAALADALAQGEPWETRPLQVLQGLGK